MVDVFCFCRRQSAVPRPPAPAGRLRPASGWRVIGRLNGQCVWTNGRGELAIERDSRVLCELSAQERRRFLA